MLTEPKKKKQPKSERPNSALFKSSNQWTPSASKSNSKGKAHYRTNLGAFGSRRYGAWTRVDQDWFANNYVRVKIARHYPNLTISLSSDWSDEQINIFLKKFGEKNTSGKLNRDQQFLMEEFEKQMQYQMTKMQHEILGTSLFPYLEIDSELIRNLNSSSRDLVRQAGSWDQRPPITQPSKSC